MEFDIHARFNEKLSTCPYTEYYMYCAKGKICCAKSCNFLYSVNMFQNFLTNLKLTLSVILTLICLKHFAPKMVSVRQKLQKR